MSITVTTDVVCDYPGCGLWETGMVGAHERSSDARAIVKQMGWARRNVAKRAGLITMVDLCPEHAEAEWT